MFGWFGGELLLHHLDPGVLVRRVRRCREDRDLTGVADLLGDQVDLRLRDALCRRLVDEQVAALGVGVGVERDDLHSGVPRLVERVADRLGVVRRDDEPARRPAARGLDEADLRGRARLRRADLGVGAAELLDRLLAARGGRVEVRVAEVLRQERDRQVAAVAAALVHRRRRRAAQPVAGERDAHGERRERAHGAALAIMTEHRCFLSWCGDRDCDGRRARASRLDVALRPSSSRSPRSADCGARRGGWRTPPRARAALR